MSFSLMSGGAESKKGPIPLVAATKYQIVGSYEFISVTTKIEHIPPGYLLLKTLTTGICQADLRYVACTRPPEILAERLPMAPFHEGVAMVVESGRGTSYSSGSRVVPVPNIPCYLHGEEGNGNRWNACPVCRPGGLGENFCAEALFLGSNIDGLAQTYLVYPADRVVPVAAQVPNELAVLAEPLSVVLGAIQAVGVTERDTVMVLGAGNMGYLLSVVLSEAFRVAKEQLIVTDLIEARLAKLNEISTTVNLRQEKVPDRLLTKVTKIFECVGGQNAGKAIDDALPFASPGCSLMLLGVSENSVSIHTRSILEKAIRVGGWTRSTIEDFSLVLDLLRERSFQDKVRPALHPKIFRANSSEDIVRACRVADDPDTIGKVIIDWCDS
jgi:ribitol-5-phosphate 2-dehydrogenase